MVEVAEDVYGLTAGQLVAWAGEHGVTVEEMRARVAGNRALMAGTAARMAEMVQKAGTRAVLDRMLERSLGRVRMLPPVPIATDG